MPPGFRRPRFPERHRNSGKVPHPNRTLPAFCTTADLTPGDLNANAVHEQDKHAGPGNAGTNTAAMWNCDHQPHPKLWTPKRCPPQLIWLQVEHPVRELLTVVLSKWKDR